MIGLEKYQNAYPNIAMERENGVLIVTLHSDGGSLKWGPVHDQLGEAFYRIGRDPGNRVMIMRGSGETYCTERDTSGYRDMTDPEDGWRVLRDARDILINLLEIEVPIISLVHGPVALHPELPALADIVLASPEASFQDSHIPAGIVAGDGCQIFWSAVLGPTRAAHFFFTERVLSAQEALQMGVVHEIHPRDALMARAQEIADRLLTKPVQTLRYTRMAVHQALKERMTKELGLGLSAEFLAMTQGGVHPAAKKS